MCIRDSRQGGGLRRSPGRHCAASTGCRRRQHDQRQGRGGGVTRLRDLRAPELRLACLGGAHGRAEAADRCLRNDPDRFQYGQHARVRQEHLRGHRLGWVVLYFFNLEVFMEYKLSKIGVALSSLCLCAGAMAQSGELRVLVANHPYGELLKLSIPQFEKDTGIKVNVESLQESQLTQKLTTEFATKSSTVDVFMTRPLQEAVSYTHLRAHETVLDLVCR